MTFLELVAAYLPVLVIEQQEQQQQQEDGAVIKTPMFTITASGSLMVILLGLAIVAIVVYISTNTVLLEVRAVKHNQAVIVASITEQTCISALPIENRAEALKAGFCESVIDRRLRKLESSSKSIRLGPPLGRDDFGG